MSRKRKRSAQPSLQHEATAADPTKQRKAKDPAENWVTERYAGGQVSHQAKTVLESVRDQLQDFEWTALMQFTELAEQALCVGDVICGRTYTGMPFVNNASTNEESAKRRSDAYAKFEGIVLDLEDEFFVTTAFALVLGVRREAGGEAVTLEEFGASLMRWRDKPTNKGGALVAIRATARVIMRAQKRWEGVARGQRRHQATVQEAFEHGRKVERYERSEALLRGTNMREQVEAHFRQQRANIANRRVRA